ncbi:cysteine-rich CWC family protein [Thiohalophilus sp.]|uniref:cysteine-rich CWC family protein n=1 Tax=Thiohalophilus sp. TaxID=3028392 RepID=UPI003974CB2E
MPKHETKECARCNTHFECKSGSIMLCQCQTVVLSTEQLEYINEQYEDCLCSRCLLAVRGEYNELQHARRIRALSKS